MAQYYDVTIAVNGYYSREVLADSIDDAVAKVIEMFIHADFGVLEDVDGNVCDVS